MPASRPLDTAAEVRMSYRNATTTEQFYETLKDEDTPDLEAIEKRAHRLAAQDMLVLALPAASLLAKAKNMNVGMAQLRYVFNVESRSMTAVAAELGVTRACLSKGVREFIKENHLPKALIQRTEEASRSYRATREAQLVDRDELSPDELEQAEEATAAAKTWHILFGSGHAPRTTNFKQPRQKAAHHSFAFSAFARALSKIDIKDLDAFDKEVLLKMLMPIAQFIDKLARK